MARAATEASAVRSSVASSRALRFLGALPRPKRRWRLGAPAATAAGKRRDGRDAIGEAFSFTLQKQAIMGKEDGERRSRSTSIHQAVPGWISCNSCCRELRNIDALGRSPSLRLDSRCSR